MKKIVGIILCLFSVSAYSDTIKVGYVSSAPFAYVDGNTDLVVGTDVNIIRSIHQDEPIRFIEYPNSKNMIESFENDGLSYGIGGISITPDRNKKVIFSIPTEKNEIHYIYSSEMYKNGVTVKGMWAVMKKGFILLFIALTVIAHTIWIVERFNKDENNFSSNYFKGIGQAYYWAVVTSSTVGYGDITPKTKLGRLITCIIIFGGIIWFGTFVSFLTGEVTRLNSNSSVYLNRDFQAIGNPTGSTSDDILSKNGSLHIQFKGLDSAFKALENGKIQCVVYDRKPLEFIIGNSGKYKLSDEILGTEYMGIICGSLELKSEVDSRILKSL